MTTAQLIQAAMPYLKWSDPSEIPAEFAIDLVAKLNLANQQYFELGPDKLKRTNAAHQLAAPATVANVDILNGETVVASGEPFTNEDRGKAVKLQGDPSWNEIVNTTTLLRPYRGTETTPDATVYSDVWAIFDTSIERAVNNVTARLEDGSSRKLTRVSKDFGEFGRTSGAIDQFQHATPYEGFYGTSGIRRTATYPSTYTVEHVGESRDASDDAVFMLRFDPIPLCGLVVEMSIDQLARAYTVDHLECNPLTLPQPDERCHSHLLPLFLGHLTSSTLWDNSDKERTRMVREDASEARRRISELPNQFANTRHLIRTKRGF